MFAWLRSALSRIAATFLSHRPDPDFDEEIETHVSMLVGKFVREGMSPEEAIYAARRQFGGITRVKEERADNRSIPHVQQVLHDGAYALRTIRKNPAFAATCALT